MRLDSQQTLGAHGRRPWIPLQHDLPGVNGQVAVYGPTTVAPHAAGHRCGEPGARRGAGIAQELRLVLAPGSRVVLLYHTGRDAPARTDRQAALLRPDADITRTLAVSCGPPGAARLRPADPACVLKVGRELLAERGSVFGVQVDLIIGPVECEPDGLLGRTAGQVVFKDDAYLLGHLHLPAVSDACTVA
jgi:hypothetical protein